MRDGSPATEVHAEKVCRFTRYPCSRERRCHPHSAFSGETPSFPSFHESYSSDGKVALGGGFTGVSGRIMSLSS